MSFQEFQKAPNRLTSRDVLILLGMAIVIVLVLTLLGVLNYYLANVLPDGGEFTLLRVGGRSFLFDHIEPYSGSVPARVQELVYGHAAQPGEDAYILDIPFHLLLLYLPLAVFSDAVIARTFWMVLTEIAFIGSTYLSFRLFGKHLSFVIRVLLIIAVFTSLYAYFSLLEGSPVFLLGLTYIGVLLSLRAGQDEVAGALLVVSAFQWEVGGPFLLLIVSRVFWEKRWRVLNGAAMSAFVLLVISFFLYPGWFMPFLRASWNSFRVGFGFSTHAIFRHLWPKFGDLLSWVLTAVLLVSLGYEWSAVRGKPFHHFVWAAFLTLAATPLLGLPTEIDQLVLLTSPLLLVLAISHERWKRFGGGIVLLLLLFYFGIPWLLYLQGVPQWIDLPLDELLFLFWPVSIVIGLYWIRWWMIRPPRTWMDRAMQMEQW